MAIEVSVLSKYKNGNELEVEVSYTCRHCGERITETLYFSDSLRNSVADVDGHECPECANENDLEVDLY